MYNYFCKIQYMVFLILRFLPHVDRMRREAGEDKRSYLDGVVYVAWALGEGGVGGGRSHMSGYRGRGYGELPAISHIGLNEGSNGPMVLLNVFQTTNPILVSSLKWPGGSTCMPFLIIYFL